MAVLSAAADGRPRPGSQRGGRRLARWWVTWASALQLSRLLAVGVAGRDTSAVAGCWSDCFPWLSPLRMISLSREYARRRVAFGKLLKDHPLHMQTIARMEVRLSGAELKLLARKGQRSSAAKEHSQPGPVCQSDEGGVPATVGVRSGERPYLSGI